MGFEPHTSSSDCGIGRDQLCDASLVVPGGTFLRGYDVAGDFEFDHPDSPATISPFRLDRYEVTVARFRAFVDAGFGTQEGPPETGAGAHAGIAWDPGLDAALATDRTALDGLLRCDAETTWTTTPGANENRAMNCIDWYEAFAFCSWDGGYLPADAEWNFAASGGDEQRAYPWSAPPSDLSIDCDHLNYGGDAWPTTVCPQGATGPTVPGSSPLGDGKYGHADLAGNVLELTLDEYGAQFPLPCDHCAATATGTGSRVAHGGAFQHAAIVERANHRAAFLPTDRYPEFGVRCARPL